MFKILYRTLIILLTAGLVSGAIYWFSTTTSGQSMFNRGGERGGERMPADFQAQSGETQPETTGEGSVRKQRPGEFGGERMRGGHGGEHGGEVNILRGLGEIPAKLAVIAGITLVIVLGRKLLSLFKRKPASGGPMPASN